MEKVKEEVGIIPSIASADPLNLQGEIDRIRDIPNLHLDIEDGCFVPNLTFGMKTVGRIAEYTRDKKAVDAHLFVMRPELWIDPLAECGVKSLAIQIESLTYPLAALNRIHQKGMKAGLGLNFATPAQVVLPFLPHLDYIIVMTAEPDGEGMIFYPEMLKKIEILSRYIGERQEIWADGGIDYDTLSTVAEAGASTVIMGRHFFSGGI